MSLLELKAHLMQTRVATLGGLAQHFCCDPEVLRCMLGHWVRKGCLKQFTKMPGCGKKCVACKVIDYEIYEWKEKE